MTSGSMLKGGVTGYGVLNGSAGPQGIYTTASSLRNMLCFRTLPPLIRYVVTLQLPCHASDASEAYHDEVYTEIFIKRSIFPSFNAT